MSQENAQNGSMTRTLSKEPILLVDPDSLDNFLPGDRITNSINLYIRIDGVWYLELLPSVWAEIYETMQAANAAVKRGEIKAQDIAPLTERYEAITDWAVARWGKDTLNAAVAELRKRRGKAA